MSKRTTTCRGTIAAVALAAATLFCCPCWARHGSNHRLAGDIAIGLGLLAGGVRAIPPPPPPPPTVIAPSPVVVPAPVVATTPTVAYGYYNNVYCPTYSGYYYYNNAWIWGGGPGVPPPPPRFRPPMGPGFHGGPRGPGGPGFHGGPRGPGGPHGPGRGPGGPRR